MAHHKIGNRPKILLVLHLGSDCGVGMKLVELLVGGQSGMAAHHAIA